MDVFNYLLPIKAHVDNFMVNAVVAYMDLKVAAMHIYPRSWTSPVKAYIIHPVAFTDAPHSVVDVSHAVGYFLDNYCMQGEYHYMRLRDVLVGAGIVFGDGDFMRITVGDLAYTISLNKRNHVGGVLAVH